MGVFIGESDSVNVVAPSGGTTAGTPVVLGDTVVYPQSTQSSGEQVTVYPEGVVLVPKVSAAITDSVTHIAAEAWVLGQAIYWDATAAKGTPKAIGPKMGICTKAAASGDAYGEVMMISEGAEIKTAHAVLSVGAGKAVGTHELVGDSLPSGAVPLLYWYYVLTTFTSATPDAATIALGLTTQDDNCFKTAVAISNGANPWDAGVPQAPAVLAAGVLTTASRTFCAVVAVEALTAGKLVLGCAYVVPGISA